MGICMVMKMPMKRAATFDDRAEVEFVVLAIGGGGGVPGDSDEQEHDAFAGIPAHESADTPEWFAGADGGNGGDNAEQPEQVEPAVNAHRLDELAVEQLREFGASDT